MSTRRAQYLKGIAPDGLAVGLDLPLAAHIQEGLQRSCTFHVEFFDAGGIKVRAAVQTDELSPEHFDVRVITDHDRVAVDGHGVLHAHGSTLATIGYVNRMA